jgi:protocatechuate 3,4-dioxygenase beta subunit
MYQVQLGYNNIESGIPVISFDLGLRSQHNPSEEVGANEDSHSEPTIDVTEGPYFKLVSRERKSLLDPGIPGDRLNLTGLVLIMRSKPVSGALLDFWQADGNGVYDNVGYKWRGHQYTDARGRYQLEMVILDIYPSRTRHIHVKVQSPGGPVLITLAPFLGEEDNQRGPFSTRSFWYP